MSEAGRDRRLRSLLRTNYLLTGLVKQLKCKDDLENWSSAPRGTEGAFLGVGEENSAGICIRLSGCERVRGRFFSVWTVREGTPNLRQVLISGGSKLI